MAMFINKIKAFFQTTLGLVILGCIYAVMLVLVLMFYTGNGTFIYEAF
jgi:hypothetical protein